MNLRFAKWLDERDEATAAALRQVVIRRHHHLSTMPSSLAVERRVNPYFRIKDRAFFDKAGGVLRTRTRPTLNRLTEFARLYEHTQ